MKPSELFTVGQVADFTVEAGIKKLVTTCKLNSPLVKSSLILLEVLSPKLPSS
jgi:hypothetical protein